MDVREAYNSLKEDYDDVLSRIGKEILVEKYVKEFTKNDYLQPLKNAYSQGEWDAAYKAANSLMGLSLNLGLKKMASLCEILSLKIKKDENSDEINVYMKDIEEEYEKTKAAFMGLR